MGHLMVRKLRTFPVLNIIEVSGYENTILNHPQIGRAHV